MAVFQLMKTSRRFRIAGLVTLLPLSLSAQVSWTGAGLDSDWATSGNWSPAAPTDADTVTISAGHAFVTTTDAVAGTLTVGNVAGSGGELTVSAGGALTVGDDGAGTLSIYKNSAVNIGSGGLAGTLSVGEITLEDSGPIDPETSPGVTLATLAFDHTDDVTFGARLSGGGLLTKTGAGTLTLTGNSVADINNAYAFGGLAQVTGGTLVLDAGTGYWDGGGDFEVSGSGSVLRIAAGTSFANDITAINGTVEVGDVLEEGFDGYTFTDATLRVLNGGAITSGDFLLGGASVLRLDGTNAISGGSFTFDGTSTLDATTPGAITDGEFIFTGDRTIALPAPGVIIGGDIVLTDNTSGTLGQTGMLVPYYDAGADEYAYLGLTATDTADISVSATGAIQNTLIAIQDESTLALGATGAVSDSMIYLIGGGTITLGANEALDDTVLLMAGDSIMVDDVEVPRAPTLDLNGHNLSLAALLGMEGLIINNTETAVTLTIGMACGCGGPGGPSGFFGTITEGSTGKIGVTVVGGSDFAIGGTQTYTGPTIVDGSGFYVVNNHDIDNNIVSGALANSPVTLQNGGRLGGDGTLLSPVTVFGGGEITPGDRHVELVAT